MFCTHWANIGLQLNRGIREQILRTTESPHRVVVNVQTEAVEAQENTHPVQVGNDRISVTDHAIQQVVDVHRRIVVPNHEDGTVSGCLQQSGIRRSTYGG